MALLPKRGVGDYGERLFHQVAPGSNRTAPPGMAVTPGQLPVGQSDALPFQLVKEVPFDDWLAYAYVIGAAAVRLDVPANLLRGRRAVKIVNTHVANAVWLGHSPSVAVNNGDYVPPGGGAVAIPLSDKAPIYAIASGPATIVSLSQYK